LKVIWSPLALEKLEETAKFIARDKPSAANKWVNDILDMTENLSQQPEMGRNVQELMSAKYRELIFGHYRIIYKIDNDIQILTVRNSRQFLTIESIEP